MNFEINVTMEGNDIIDVVVKAKDFESLIVSSYFESILEDLEIDIEYVEFDEYQVCNVDGYVITIEETDGYVNEEYYDDYDY